MNFHKYFAFIAVLVLCLFVAQGEAGWGKKINKAVHKVKHAIHEAGHVAGDVGKIAAGAAAVGAVAG